jgi:hypothetical protein
MRKFPFLAGLFAVAVFTAMPAGALIVGTFLFLR